MANQWFRMYAEFASDPKVQMLSEADQRRYVMLLCLRCSNERVTLQDEEVTFLLRISKEDWECTKAVLVAKNLIDEANNPTAWEKRQYSSDSSRARVAAHRERKKRACNVTVTPPDTDTDTEKEEHTSALAATDPCPAVEDSDQRSDPIPIDRIPYEQIRELYNAKLGGTLSRRLAVSQTDRKHIRAAYNLTLNGQPLVRDGGLEFWEGLFNDVLELPFLLGRNDRGWRADFEFLTKSANIQKILEGKYDRAA